MAKANERRSRLLIRRSQELSWLQALRDKVQARINIFESEAAEVAAAPIVIPVYTYD